MQLRVPASYLGAFQWLADLDEAASDALLGAFAASRTWSRKAIIEQAAAATDAGRREVEVLFDATIALVRTLQEGGVPLGSPHEVAKVIAHDPSLPDTLDSTALENRIVRLLETTSITRLAKAMDLQAEHQNVFRVARIFSEFRPLFTADLSVDSRSVSLTHTLKIEFYNGVLDVENIYLAMDSADLVRLKGVLEREITKLEKLDTLLTDNKIERIALIQEED